MSMCITHLLWRVSKLQESSNHQTQKQCTFTHGCMHSMLNTDIIYNHLQSPSKSRPVPCDLTAGHCGILITAVIVFYVYGAGSDPTLCSCSYWTAWPPLSSDCGTLTRVCKPARIQSESTCMFTSVWYWFDRFKWSDLRHYLKFNCHFYLSFSLTPFFKKNFLNIIWISESSFRPFPQVFVKIHDSDETMGNLNVFFIIVSLLKYLQCFHCKVKIFLLLFTYFNFIFFYLIWFISTISPFLYSHTGPKFVLTLDFPCLYLMLWLTAKLNST